MIKSTFLKSWLLLLCMIVGSSAAWAQSDYSQTYTTGSDITWAHGVKVSINGTDYDANKLGTTSSAGSTKFTVPSGTKYLHLHIAGWNNETVKLSVNAGSTTITSLAITSDAGISGGGSTFTISDDADLSKFYHVVTFTNALSSNTEIEIKATSGKRFVIWGIIAEEENATPLASNDLALTDAPVALRFDLYNNKASQTVSFTTSSTGEVTVSESEFVTTSISGNTITVTPIKVTPSPQTISVSQAADDTYATGSVTFTVSIDDSTPFDGGDVTFDATKDKGTSPLTKEVVTFTCSNGVLNNGSEYRLYKNSTTTFSVSEGTITKIVFTGTSGNPASGFGNQTGWTTSGNNGTWVGSAKEVSFTASGAQVRATQIVVTVESATANPAVVTTVTIDDANLTNTNVFDGTAAGKLTASVKAADGGPIDGATVTWTSSEEAVATIATDGTVTLVDAGTTTITANYAGVENQYRPSSATYELTVTNIDPNAPGTENKPYTIAQARAAIDAGTGVTGVYATGTVSEIVTAYNSQFGNITYNISTDGTTTADQLQAYRGKSYNGDKFTSEEDIQVGDVVVVYGNLTKYGSTYEFAQDNQLVSLDRPVVTTPVINADNVELAYDATSGEIAYTINNPATGVALNATTTADWISNIAVTDDKVTFTTTENDGSTDRKATFTLSYQGATDKEVTVTQKHQTVDYATLPFDWAGGVKADLMAMNGVSANGLGSDYAAGNAPYNIKFDGKDDYIQVKTDGQPGIVTIGVKMIGGASTSKIKVQESSDGQTFTDVEEFTISGAQNEVLTFETNTAFADASRYVRIIKSVHGSNVGVGAISIAKPVAPSTDPVINANDVELEYDATSGEIAYTITNLNPTVGLTATTTADWISDIDVTTEKVTFTTTANDGDADRTATIKLTYPGATDKEVTVTQKHFVKDYATLPFCWEGGAKADLEALTGVSANGLGSDYAASNAPYLIKLDGTGDYIQVKTDGQILNVTAEVKMLGGSNTSSITVQSSADGTTFTDVEVLSISGAQNDVLALETTKTFGANDRYVRLLFTKGSNVGVGAITINCVRKSISDAEYATYCSPYALDFTNVSGLTAYEATIDGTTVAFNEGDKVFAAGEGILLKGSEGAYTIPVIASATANTNNKLVGVLADTEVTDTGIFVLMNGNNGVGFYKTKSAFTVGAHTAYLPAQAGGNGARDFIGIDDNTTTGVNSIDNGQWTIDNVYNLNGQRVNNAKKGLYIVNGKKVVVK